MWVGRVVTAGVTVSSGPPTCAFVLVTSRLMIPRVVIARMTRKSVFRIIEYSIAVSADLELRHLWIVVYTNKRMLDVPVKDVNVDKKASQSVIF
jgi:hypothetical protein